MQYNSYIFNYIQKINNHPLNILDVGCNKGDLGLAILEKFPDSIIIGIEKDPITANIANQHFQVLNTDIEKPKLLKLKHNSFDYIIFSDILEHLINPKEALIYFKKYLKPNGRILICIPNIQHILIILNLIYGKFIYTDQGILSHSHLRFFSHQDFLNLLNDAGIFCLSSQPIYQCPSLFQIFYSHSQLDPSLIEKTKIAYDLFINNDLKYREILKNLVGNSSPFLLAWGFTFECTLTSM